MINNIKTWFKNQITAVAISMSSVEKNIFGQNKELLLSDTKQEVDKQQGTLAHSLIRGELTQEVKNLRWRTYKVLKASKNISLKENSSDDNGNIYYTITKNKNELNKLKVDLHDTYKPIMVVNNENNYMGMFEKLDKIKSLLLDDKDNELPTLNYNQITSITNNDFALQIQRKTLPKFYIERYTKKLIIRKINDVDYLLEFYVNKYKTDEPTHNMFTKLLQKKFDDEQIVNDTFEIDSVYFISNNTVGSEDFMEYEFKVKSYDKIVYFDGNFVVKFIASNTINGRDILIDYIEPDLELKYNTKEKK